MYGKRRKVPPAVNIWMEKDVRVTKLAPKLGMMKNDTRQSVLLNRQFYSDMFTLSSERFEKINELDQKRKKFIKNQYGKAETTLPGMLPYIENFTKEVEADLTARNFYSKSKRSYQSPFLVQSSTKLDTTPRLMQTQEPTKKPSQMRLGLPTRNSSRREKTIDSVNRFSKSKHRNESPFSPTHIRPTLATSLTVDDLFGSLDDFSSYSPSSYDKPKTPTTDRRYQRLFHLFADVYRREPSNLNSVRSIVESNPSLKTEGKQWERVQTPNINMIREEHHRASMADDYYASTTGYSTEIVTSDFDC